MKRIGGSVVWECRFGRGMEKLIRAGKKFRTLRAGHRVMPDDALRLTDTFGITIQEVNARAVASVLICAGEREITVLVDGERLSESEKKVFAKKDGFGSIAELVEFLHERGKLANGVFDGQVIGW